MRTIDCVPSYINFTPQYNFINELKTALLPPGNTPDPPFFFKWCVGLSLMAIYTIPNQQLRLENYNPIINAVVNVPFDVNYKPWYILRILITYLDAYPYYKHNGTVVPNTFKIYDRTGGNRTVHKNDKKNNTAKFIFYMTM